MALEEDRKELETPEEKTQVWVMLELYPWGIEEVLVFSDENEATEAYEDLRVKIMGGPFEEEEWEAQVECGDHHVRLLPKEVV